MTATSAHEATTWIGILACLSQSAAFSGLNLAMFGISRLRLETAASTGNRQATRILALRRDSNFLLTTILWGNVASNVLLTLLADSVLAGAAAFFFSTFAITFLGEILPQAFFSRNALRIGALLSPLLRFYQILLYPVAKPTAKVLDWWLGPEMAEFLREHDLRMLIRRHAFSRHADEVSRIEGIGAANFLALDDVPSTEEGEPVDPQSVVSLPFEGGRPVFPEFHSDPADPFLRGIHASKKKWVVITDPSGEARLLMDADGFLSRALFGPAPFNPLAFCHRPIVSRDPSQCLETLISELRVQPQHPGDDVVDRDTILLWTEDVKRIITGADILGRLLRGITQVDSPEQRRGKRAPTG
jgi:hypothetical protein